MNKATHAKPAHDKSEADEILKAAERGDQNALHLATVLGHSLSGDERDKLFADVRALLARHPATAR